jgi:sensitive to high expression protein 9
MEEEKKKKPMGSSDPIPMPPPSSPPSSPPPSSGINFDDIPEHLIPPHLRPVKVPEPPKEEPKPAEDTKQPAESETTEPETTSKNPLPEDGEQRPQNDTVSSTKQTPAADNVAPVPDEHLPSHHQGQRWDFSKRLQELMDEVLPKLAVVTQKVNTYTGTDYSGVAALRREIKEQGILLASYTTSLA